MVLRSSIHSPKSISRQRFEQNGRNADSSDQRTDSPHCGQLTTLMGLDDALLEGKGDIFAHLLGSFALFRLF